jgi:predicted PurR-regulated permease PerM
VTYSVVISTGTIAVLQGALLGLAFYIFGLPGALLWGFVAAVLSFLPVVGPSLVWGPASLLMLLTQNYVAGIGILVFGLVLSNVDNFLRPLIQRQVGRMHPLVSLIGIFIGIPIFGILGLIIGPLMLSYFFLTLKMFREEYLST